MHGLANLKDFFYIIMCWTFEQYIVRWTFEQYIVRWTFEQYIVHWTFEQYILCSQRYVEHHYMKYKWMNKWLTKYNVLTAVSHCQVHKHFIVT